MWRPHRPLRDLGSAQLQALRAGHSHEAAHDVTVGDRNLRVLPDGHTAARRRYDTILRAYDSESVDRLALVVGSLVLIGATNLELDGRPLIPNAGRRGEWRILLNDDGSMAATFLGATE